MEKEYSESQAIDLIKSFEKYKEREKMGWYLIKLYNKLGKFNKRNLLYCRLKSTVQQVLFPELMNVNCKEAH